MFDENCIFCKIVKGEIPSMKIYDSDHVYGFMDINPISEGHCLFIPKSHAARVHEVDDSALSEILIAIKKVAKALEIVDYNILQNNGRIAHQEVFHTHFHLIPKPDANSGLKIGWNPLKEHSQEDLANKINENLNN